MNNYDTNSFKRADFKRGWDGDRNQIKEAPSDVKSKSKKDTKKWCKGVVGREHKSVWVYSELLWGHRRGEEVTETPIPPLDRPKFNDRGHNIWYRDPWATKYCTVCKKHIKFAEDAFGLRRKGISILTRMPE